jgi:hypothetical protein
MRQSRSAHAPGRWLAALSVATLIVATGGPAAAQVSPSARQACRADVQAYCAGIQPGGGRIKACLQANAARLSPPCRAEFARATRLPG